MRISYGVQWNEQVEKAVKTLGELVFEYSVKRQGDEPDNKLKEQQ